MNLDCANQDVATLNCIWVIIKNVYVFSFYLAAVVAVILIVYSGIKFITSEGDKTKIESAKKTLTYTIIGLIFIILSFLIVKFIADLTGTDINLLITPPTLQ